MSNLFSILALMRTAAAIDRSACSIACGWCMGDHRPVGAVTDGSVPEPAGAAVGATCVVCDAPATFLVLGSYRCVSHRETTVVGEAPRGPGRTVEVEFNRRHYTDCIEGYCKCGGDGK